jgi:hypothetical protein
MDSIAEKLHIEKPSDWYNVTGKDLQQYQGGHAILNHHKHSVLRILKAVYPEYPSNILTAVINLLQKTRVESCQVWVTSTRILEGHWNSSSLYGSTG